MEGSLRLSVGNRESKRPQPYPTEHKPVIIRSPCAFTEAGETTRRRNGHDVIPAQAGIQAHTAHYGLRDHNSVLDVGAYPDMEGVDATGPTLPARLWTATG